MECRAIGRRCTTGTATVLGDFAQATTPWGVQTWAELLSHLSKPSAEVRVLETGYRVPRQILDFANRLLPHLTSGAAPGRSLREDPASLRIVKARESLALALVGVAAVALDRPGSAAVIAADDQIVEIGAVLNRAGLPHGVLDAGDPGEGITIVPATLAKGLEYDDVIVAEPARIVAAEARGLNRLYVALTRAVSHLTVVYYEPLPEPLR